MLQLREYQGDSMTGLREGFADGHRLQMLYLPTGGGKTEIAISMLDAAEKKGKRAAMLLDRRVLCDQTSERLNKYQISHGVLMAGHWNYKPDRKIQICSAQTLEKRDGFPAVDILIIDEAHCMRKSVIEFIKARPEIKVVGLSASPFTKGLGSIFTNVVSRSTTRDLVDMGMLAPLRVFLAKAVDMTGAKKIAGEWSDKEATERGIKITGDVVSEWVKKTHEIFGEPKKTIVFSAGVAHGIDLQQKFAEAGYNFISISYKDDDEYKKEVIADFSKSDTKIHGLIATDILTKGFDVSDVMIGVSARPFSKSFSSHVQQMGRVMRQCEGKNFAVWLDHSGNYMRFKGQWDELYCGGVDELDDGAEKSTPEPTDKEKEAAKCPKCSALWPSNSDVCVNCGMVRVRRNDVISIAGEMEELVSMPKVEKYSSEYKEEFYRGLLGYAKAKNFKDGWAYFQYQAKFNIKPAWKKIIHPPSIDVKNWITSEAIRKSKRKSA